MFTLSIVTIVSCSKNNGETENSFKKIETEVRELVEPIGQVWNYAYVNYTMEELCACNCNAANIAQNVINSQFALIPEYEDLPLFDYSCDELFERISTTCDITHDEKISLIDSLNNLSITSNYITPQEQVILENLVEQISTNPTTIPFQTYYAKLKKISDNTSSTQLALTTNLLINTENAIDYFSEIEPPNGSDDTQFLINKALGGLASAYMGWCWDIYDNGGGGGENAPRNAVRNFVGGAITSL